MRWIAALKLKDFNMSMQIEYEKMRGRVCRFMSYERIGLVGSRSAIMQIIPGRRVFSLTNKVTLAPQILN